MATVYSLICFGGKDGKTVTFTDAGDVVNLTNHGLRDATGVVFTDNSGNTLPTGLSKNTTYYAKSTGANTFTLYTSSALTTQVTFTGTGSGTHKVKGAYYYGLSDTSRWATTRIYDGLVAWNTGRAGASSYDVEVCEIGEAWTETISANLQITVPASAVIITTEVNGVRSSGHHNGVYGAGYLVTGAYVPISPQRNNITYSGFSVKTTGASSNVANISFMVGTVLSGMILEHGHATPTAANCYVSGGSTQISNCVIIKGTYGIAKQNYYAGCVFSYNVVTGCSNTGIACATNDYCYYYNNISIGNTANWNTATATIFGAAGNAGVTGDAPFDTVGSTAVTVASTDFTNYAGYDFSPAAVTSPQVETGVRFYNDPVVDIQDAVRPNYMNGAAAYPDVGPFEWDHGYGAWPNSVTVAGSGIVDGTRIKIAKQSDGTEYRNVVLSGATTDSFSQDAPSDIPVYVYARKGSAAPYYKPIKVSATILADGGLTYNLTGLQIPDIAASTYAAGVATDWTINTGTGAITHTSGTTRYSVQDLYSYHQDYTDDSGTVDDDPLMDGTTSTVFSLINTGAISDADHELLYGGSISEASGATLWSSLYSAGSLSGTPALYVVQNGAKLTSFWAAGHLDILVKVKASSALIDSGLVTVYARKYGYTFSHYQVDLSGGGRSVAPLSTLAEATTTTISSATAAGYTDIGYTWGGTSQDLGEGGGAGTYYCRIDCAGRTLDQVFARTMYDCRDASTTTLNSLEGWRYQKAHANYTANAAMPFGAYSGGFWNVAQGVWLDNVAAADQYNYELTDHAGVTHGLTQPAGAVTATLAANTRVVLYNTTQATEIDNALVSGAYSYTITTEAATNDVLTLYYFKEGYEEGSSTLIWSGTTAAFVVSQVEHPYIASLRTELSITDYTTITEFALDVTGTVEIDADDADGQTQKARLAIWYNGILTTENGARYLRGAISVLATNQIRINTDVLDLKLENVSVTQGLRFTDNDRRLWRTDGTAIYAATSAPGSIQNDYSGVPDTVETGVSGLTGPESAQLMGIPTNPLLTTDSRLNTLDAAISSRLASASYTAPPSAASVRAEIDANSTKLDVAVSSRLATSGYTAPDTAAEIADQMLNRSIGGGADGGRTVKDSLRAIRNKTAIDGETLTVYQEDDATPAWTASITTGRRDPMTGVNPA